jgi:hypothetical protein
MRGAVHIIEDCPERATAPEVFKKWYFRATHSRLEPFAKPARTLKNHNPRFLKRGEPGLVMVLMKQSMERSKCR